MVSLKRSKKLGHFMLTIFFVLLERVSLIQWGSTKQILNISILYRLSNHGWNNRLIDDQTTFNHSNYGLVFNSDPSVLEYWMSTRNFDTKISQLQYSVVKVPSIRDTVNKNASVYINK